MKRLAILIGSVFFLANDAAEACGRCRVAHSRPRRVAFQPRPITYGPAATPTPAVAYSPQTASPPMTYAQPVAAPQPAMTPSSPGGVQPTYNYLAANPEAPAYYYTYDNSGKLVVSQWVDWLFRGGRAEGMPRPPLPIIGALSGANR